jgi:hypothetical protein
MPDLEQFQTLGPNVGTNIAANVAPTCVGNANVCACGERQRHANASNGGSLLTVSVFLSTENVGSRRPRPQNHRLLPTLLSSESGLKKQTGWRIGIAADMNNVQ